MVLYTYACAYVGCLLFRNSFIESTKAMVTDRRGNEEEAGVDPFSYPTIASACMATVRHKFLNRNHIGYFRTSKDIHPAESIRYFEWIMHSENRRLRHARNHPQGEKWIAGERVDGYDENDGCIFEFNGCYWHSCPKCFPKSNRVYYERQLAKEEKLRTKGYIVRSMWECEWRVLRSGSPRCTQFLESHDQFWDSPLNPRDAFFGGRTNASILYKKCAPGERIDYDDVCSMYPSANASKDYPIGMPEIFLNPPVQDLYQKKYFGVVKCMVTPPRKLFHPVLPVRLLGKLFFPLCRSCVQSKATKCIHNGIGREFMGTWATPELYRAMDAGYEVTKVREVHHFPNRKNGLFKDYVYTFLKGKQDASGWPAANMTNEQKNDYVRRYEENQQVKLDPALIRKNPGRRRTCKITLNSMWGKFGQRGNMAKSKVCMSKQEFLGTIFNERLEVTAIFICPSNTNCVEVQYKEVESLAEEPTTTNVYIALFTTAHARLMLYDHLETLGERVLYFDTDSVIYLTKPGQERLKLGEYLDDMTSELPADRHIDEFVSTGPKSYSYRDSHGAVTCKFKGIRKNLHNLKVINFESMLACISEGVVKKVHGAKNMIFRIDPFGRITTLFQPKVFQMTYTKRYIEEQTYHTFPFGY